MTVNKQVIISQEVKARDSFLSATGAENTADQSKFLSAAAFLMVS